MPHWDPGGGFRKPRGRPILKGSAKFVRLKGSVYQWWEERKTSLGTSTTNDSAFAEMHSLPDENRRKVSRKEVSSYHSWLCLWS